MATKRKASPGVGGGGADKKHKAQGKRKWTVPRREKQPQHSRREIQPGDVGIWATCAMKQEARCVAELRTLLEEYADKLYGPDGGVGAAGEDESDGADVEAALQRELQDLRDPQSEPRFQSVRLETPCLIFFRTRAPIDPVELVGTICRDAAASPGRKQSRSVKRLTPIVSTGKSTENGLREVARQALASLFHEDKAAPRTFAIRPNLRNHTSLKRDEVIKIVAQEVGPGHTVELKSPEVIVLVEIYQNICGVSAINGEEYERLKRYNLSELHEPSAANTTGRTEDSPGNA